MFHRKPVLSLKLTKWPRLNPRKAALRGLRLVCPNEMQHALLYGLRFSENGQVMSPPTNMATDRRHVTSVR